MGACLAALGLTGQKCGTAEHMQCVHVGQVYFLQAEGLAWIGTDWSGFHKFDVETREAGQRSAARASFFW